MTLLSKKWSDASILDATSLEAGDKFLIIQASSGLSKKVTASLISTATILYKKVTLTSAQVLASFTTKVEVIADPGAGKFIEILGGSAFLDYGTATYAANKNCILLPSSETNLNNAGWNVGATSSFLFSTADARCYLEKETGAQQIITNTGISFQTRTADPTTGDSPLTLYIAYRIVTA